MNVGRANGIDFNLSDLGDIASTFKTLKLAGKVPLKMGHNDQQPFTDGQPALGWVDRVYVEDDTLYGDFTDMPTVVYDLIKAGSYKHVSVELLKNVQAGTRSLPWVLDAVALLGADQPAFGNLKDLQALTLKRGPVLQASARVAFTRDRKFFSTGDKPTMTPEEIQKVVADAIAAERASNEAARTKDRETFTAELKKRDEQLHTQRVEFHRSQVKTKFETAVADGTLLPAKREQFYKFAKVETDAVLDIKTEDVDAYIKDNAQDVKLSRKATSVANAEDAKAEEGLRADQIVDLRAKKLCYSRNQDPTKHDVYVAAVKEVLADEKLGDSYKFMPDTEYRAAS